jgi:hypothetical protein
MERGTGRKHRGIIGRLKENLFMVGLLSILWFIFRTGRKPSRVAYPCQQVAAFNGNIWIATYILPIVSALPSRPSFLSDRRKLTALVAAVVVISAGVGFVWWRFYGDRVTPLGETTTEYGLTLTARAANYTPASDIFVVSGAKGNDDGLDELLDLMGGQGLKFYESGRNGENKGPDGLISGDDVILIKVNCQWDERGGTNTDLLKALIQAVVDHPDGFTGEIIVADAPSVWAGASPTRGTTKRIGPCRFRTLWTPSSAPIVSQRTFGVTSPRFRWTNTQTGIMVMASWSTRPGTLGRG